MHNLVIAGFNYGIVFGFLWGLLFGGFFSFVSLIAIVINLISGVVFTIAFLNEGKDDSREVQ
jgi:hypothetical protein